MDSNEFEAELRSIVDQARESGVDLRGGYTIRTPKRDQPDFTVEISEVRKASPSSPFNYKEADQKPRNHHTANDRG